MYSKILFLFRATATTLFFGYSGVNFADTGSQTPTAQLAPAYRDLTYQLPQPGSYELPILGTAGDGEVLTENGQKTQLTDLFKDKIVLLSFVYSTCSDANGCPLATMVLHKIKGKLQQESALKTQLRLLTLSFNPAYDTPERMRAYGKSLKAPNIDWQFLTTDSEASLAPILAAYPHRIAKVFDKQGHFTNTFNHDLRLYLIDAQGKIRNIYSTSILHADLVINDIKNLLAPRSTIAPATALIQPDDRFSAGDNKQNYVSADYQTHSLALKERQGQALDLLHYAQQAQLGLPPLPTPADNPLTQQKISLGRKLFFDRRLSLNNTVSCAMCHIPEQGFTSQELSTSVGIEGRTVRRNAPTLFNVAYAKLLFHDGREDSLEQQIWGPLLAENEMGNRSIGQVLAKIRALPDYQGLFEQTFGKDVDLLNIGMALASYQRALITADSPFDRWYFGKQSAAISDSAQRGFKLFTGKAKCSACHEINEQQALFMDQQWHNTGIGYQAAMFKTPPKVKVQIAPGQFTEIQAATLQSVSGPQPNDLGRYEVTQNPANRWQYKTPSLRNIAITAPYMHNGSLASLREVVEFYNRGGVSNENRDPLINALNLNSEEIGDLLAFLNSLTSLHVQELVADAFAAPVGN